ncbi:Ras family GTPase [Entamoeba histolytica]|uniref:Ras family GTPase n=2 Tax=Entamoeba histolytica TaxID=5759 RepID=C4M5F8_ENTH1|nr:Ras family GTPase [Entamoeba histolytica HM-1:IMSS]EAL44906.2 Ras family GTPase [Entamoeba histolytica HM-1:IMSS]GAT96663.1 Ras family GTPase [Entamoeba histolytica]|eukprot:XP_650292.2 Ras family GTPase [Entamoeba histolytica HM-1:IMSS]
MSVSGNPYKLVALGKIDSGKTSILIRFFSGHFFKMYDPGIEDEYRTVMKVDDISIIIDVADPCSGDEFSILRDLYIKQSDGFILIYSITSKESFEEMKGIYEEIYRVKDKDENEVIPIIIVGNKCDLENERQVTKEDGIEYADSVKCPFLECSAKTNENINQIFDIITRNVVEYKYSIEEEIWTIEKPKKEKGCCLF